MKNQEYFIKHKIIILIVLNHDNMHLWLYFKEEMHDIACYQIPQWPSYRSLRDLGVCLSLSFPFCSHYKFSISFPIRTTRSLSIFFSVRITRSLSLPAN